MSPVGHKLSRQQASIGLISALRQAALAISRGNRVYGASL